MRLSSISSIIFVLLETFLMLSCSSSQMQVRTRNANNRDLSINDALCLDLLERRDTAQLLGKVFVGVGGIGAFGAVPEQIPEAGRWGIAGGAAGLSALGIAAAWYGDKKGEEFEKYCETNDEKEMIK